MIPLLSIPLLAFLFMFMSFTINNSRFLMSLLCLEGMMLSLVIYIPMMSSSTMTSNPSTALILLTFGACEASLGLSILVKMSRHYGSDSMSSLTLNKC